MPLDRDLFGEIIAPARRVGRRVFLSVAARARAQEMRRQGASLAAISEALGIAVETVRTRLKVELERGLPGGRKAGRPRWSPTNSERANVARLAAVGVTRERIAEALGVTSPTLRRHCAEELKTLLAADADG